MSELYLPLKWLHVLSATVLFGTGLGTAFYMWSAHRTGDPRTIAAVGRMVVRADWIFTGTSGVLQPATGAALIWILGLPWDMPWLLVAYGLYALAFACWAPVVRLQIRAQRLAAAAAASGTPLPTAYHVTMRYWFILGWPAFLALLCVFWLMLAKPDL
ncbi:MAG: DUF2269 domain-containing protein [Alphaproteobacteria bacterium]|nr:DUF2269 domain-containing protein [Alphaproteobacteria bacterium]